MAGYSSDDVQGLISSTYKGLDRCASLLQVLAGPTTASDKMITNRLFPGAGRHSDSLHQGHCDNQSVKICNKENKPVQSSSDISKYPNRTTMKKATRHVKKKTLYPVTTSTPVISPLRVNDRVQCCPHCPWSWSRHDQSSKPSHLERDLTEALVSLKQSQLSLQQYKIKLSTVERERDQLQLSLENAEERIQHLQAHHDILCELKEETKSMTLCVEQLQKENNILKCCEENWKEKYVKLESQYNCEKQETEDDMQMLKLSLAEKETELLQCQDTLLGIRQCLAQLLIDIKPHPDNHEWSMFPHKNVLKLQTIVNTGGIEENSDYITPVNSISSTPTPSWDKMTSITSNTELEFRKDLATLDADIARLQIHFNVSKQNE